MWFHTGDAARVQEAWKQYVPSAVLHGVDQDRLRYEWHSVDLEGVSVVRYNFAADVNSTVEPQGQIVACRVDGPRVAVGSERADLDGTRPWISGGERLHARWAEEALVTALVFTHEYLEGVARQVSGDDGLSLFVTGAAARDARAAACWNRMFGYVERAVTPLDHRDLLLWAELARHAAVVTLDSFSTTMPRVSSEQTRPAPRTVRLACQFMDEHAHLPITIDDVTAAAHISTRGLQYAFRRALDLTPMEYLRRARLDGAHRELRFGAPSTVGAVARRWGFSHPSRFAATYREAYGEPPSATARENW